jgi:Zn-dependent dipeptidase, microsomal dipeptidase homolog
MHFIIRCTLYSVIIFHVQTMDAQNYLRLHNRAIVIDTHNDILTECFEKHYSFDQDLKGKTHSDISRFRKGGVDVQIFSVWCDGNKKKPFAYANAQIDTLYATVQRNPSKITIARSTKELLKAVRDKKLAAMIGVEGGHMIEDDMNKLDTLFKRGARYMTLTWNNSTTWATSAQYESSVGKTAEPDSQNLPQHKGLTDFGKQLVRHMNDLGMLVDLSHVGEQTFWDAIATARKPVLVSHSNAYQLCPVFRNLKDEQIIAVGKNGGVIHLNFFSGFLDSNYNKREAAFFLKHKTEKDSILKLNPEPYFANDYLFKKYNDEVQSLRAPLSLLLDHLDYMVKLIGVDHVGLGSDFDGIPSTPLQLDDVTNYPLVTKALLERGYRKKDIKKILGGNFLRLLKANEEKSSN